MNLCEKLSQPEFTAGPDDTNSGRVGFCSVFRGNTSFHIGKINWVGKKTFRLRTHPLKSRYGYLVHETHTYTNSCIALHL